MERKKASWKFSTGEKENIVKLWKSGHSTITISRMFECCDEAIRELMLRRVPKVEYMKIANDHMKRFEEKRELHKIKEPKLNKDLAWWIGVVKGDGYVDTKWRRVRLGVIDKTLCYKWSEIGKSLFGIEPKKKIIIRYDKPFYLSSFNSKLLVDFIKANLGYFGYFEWNIPNNILTSDNRIKASFLKGLYDAEGSFKPASKQLTLTSVNKNSMNIVQNLLLDLGIESRIRIESRKDRKNSYAILTISNIKNLLKFSHWINFTVPHKQIRLKNYIEYMDMRGYINAN